MCQAHQVLLKCICSPRVIKYWQCNSSPSSGTCHCICLQLVPNEHETLENMERKVLLGVQGAIILSDICVHTLNVTFTYLICRQWLTFALTVSGLTELSPKPF